MRELTLPVATSKVSSESVMSTLKDELTALHDQSSMAAAVGMSNMNMGKTMPPDEELKDVKGERLQTSHPCSRQQHSGGHGTLHSHPG